MTDPIAPTGSPRGLWRLAGVVAFLVFLALVLVRARGPRPLTRWDVAEDALVLLLVAAIFRPDWLDRWMKVAADRLPFINFKLPPAPPAP